MYAEFINKILRNYYIAYIKYP